MWEYLVRDEETDDLEGWLNIAGQRGWELMHYRYIPGTPGLPEMGVEGTAAQHELILKRPLK